MKNRPAMSPAIDKLFKEVLSDFDKFFDELEEGFGYNLNNYQDDALKTAVYPDSGKIGGLTYTILGLCGEAGELANKLKKHLRNGTPIDQDVLRDELSDVMWYVAATTKELNTTMSKLAEYNINKLTERQKSGTLKDR